MFDLNNIRYPSPLHSQYLRTMHAFCRLHGVGLLLHGSLREGNATVHSDIDLIALRDDFEDIFPALLSTNGTPDAIMQTVNPAGIFVLSYANGLTIDLDLRTKVTYDEYYNSTSITSVEPEWIGFSDGIRWQNTYTQTFIPILQDDSVRLFHRALLKKLSGHDIMAHVLMEELMSQVAGHKEQVQNKKQSVYMDTEQFKRMWALMQRNIEPEEGIYRVLENLMKKL